MLERRVDHAVRRVRARPQTVEVVEGTAVHLRPRGRQRRGGPVRAGEAENPVSRVQQFAYDGAADESGGSGDEHTHGALQKG